MPMSLKYLCQFAQFLAQLNIMIFKILHFHQLSNTKWYHLAKDKNSLFSYFKQLKKWLFWTFLAFWLSPNVIKKLTSWTPLYHLKICLICPLFYAKCMQDVMSPFADASYLWDFCQVLVESADQIANKYNACYCSSRSWTTSIFPSFNTLLQSILFSNLSRLFC